MKYFYILTTKLYQQRKEDRYKLGYSTQTLTQLIRRYTTSLPDIIILKHIEHNNSKLIETRMLEHFNNYRIKNINGNLSEWISGVPFKQIERQLDKVIKEVSCTDIVISNPGYMSSIFTLPVNLVSSVLILPVNLVSGIINIIRKLW